MAAEKFQLSTYTPHILRLADHNKCSVEVALQCFIANLSTMREYYKGASELNYHELGQHWNRLLSEEKVAQKSDALARLQKYPRSGGKA